MNGSPEKHRGKNMRRTYDPKTPCQLVERSVSDIKCSSCHYMWYTTDNDGCDDADYICPKCNTLTGQGYWRNVFTPIHEEEC